MGKTSAELFVEAQAQYNAFSFYKKLGFNNMVRNMGGTTSTVSLEMDGYLFSNAGKSVVLGDGDYYVYVWKHAWGEPFYVGSGRGDRWITKAPRNPQFYYHLDNADAAVYKVVSGMNEETARMCEANVVASCYLYAAEDITDFKSIPSNGGKHKTFCRNCETAVEAWKRNAA